MLTITVGLLIAVGIKECVEWRHHVHLVEEARSTLRAEIAYNQDRLRRAVPVLQKDRAENDANLALLRQIQEHPASKAGQNASLGAHFVFSDLRDTAWRTAESSGALGYMPYEEAQRYAGVYQAQAAFVASEKAAQEDVGRFLGFVYKFNLSGPGAISAEEASAMAEGFGTWKFHLVMVDSTLKEATMYDEALLQGKPEPKGVAEDFR